MCDNERKSLESRARAVRMLYTFANLYVLTTIFISLPVVSHDTSMVQALISNHFSILLIFTVTLWVHNRPCRKIHSVSQQRYLFVSRVILAVGWGLVLVRGLIIGGALQVVMVPLGGHTGPPLQSLRLCAFARENAEAYSTLELPNFRTSYV